MPHGCGMCSVCHIRWNADGKSNRHCDIHEEFRFELHSAYRIRTGLQKCREARSAESKLFSYHLRKNWCRLLGYARLAPLGKAGEVSIHLIFSAPQKCSRKDERQYNAAGMVQSSVISGVILKNTSNESYATFILIKRYAAKNILNTQLSAHYPVIQNYPIFHV